MLDYDALYIRSSHLLSTTPDDAVVAHALGVKIEDVLVLRGIKATAPRKGSDKAQAGQTSLPPAART